MEPALICGNDSLGTKHHSVFFFVFDLMESRFKLVLRIFACAVNAPAGEHLVSVVVMMVTAASAGALFIMVVMMLMAFAFFVVMVMLMAVALFVVMVMMLVAAAFFIVMMMMLVTTAFFIVMMMMMLVTTALFIVVVMMMVASGFLFHLVKLILKAVASVNNGKNISAADVVPFCCYKSCSVVVFSDHFNCAIEFFV